MTPLFTIFRKSLEIGTYTSAPPLFYFLEGSFNYWSWIVHSKVRIKCRGPIILFTLQFLNQILHLTILSVRQLSSFLLEKTFLDGKSIRIFLNVYIWRKFSVNY